MICSNIRNILSHFTRDDEAAVTVDWVVLTAAIVVIAASVFVVIQPGIDNISSNIATSLSGVLT